MNIIIVTMKIIQAKEVVQYKELMSVCNKLQLQTQDLTRFTVNIQTKLLQSTQMGSSFLKGFSDRGFAERVFHTKQILYFLSPLQF